MLTSAAQAALAIAISVALVVVACPANDVKLIGFAMSHSWSVVYWNKSTDLSVALPVLVSA